MVNDKEVMLVFMGQKCDLHYFKSHVTTGSELVLIPCDANDVRPTNAFELMALPREMSPTLSATTLMSKKPLGKTKGPKPSPNASKNPFPKNSKPASFGKTNQRFAKAGRGR
jgi:hypothetical protein